MSARQVAFGFAGIVLAPRPPFALTQVYGRSYAVHGRSPAIPACDLQSAPGSTTFRRDDYRREANL